MSLEKPVHFRVCHVCGQLNHRESNKVDRCLHCQHSLAQFYYFDDRFSSVMSDTGLRVPISKGEFQPVQGLTVYWESF